MSKESGSPEDLGTDSDSETECSPEKHQLHRPQSAGVSESRIWDQVELGLNESSLGMSQLRGLGYFHIHTFFKGSTHAHECVQVQGDFFFNSDF